MFLINWIVEGQHAFDHSHEAEVNNWCKLPLKAFEALLVSWLVVVIGSESKACILLLNLAHAVSWAVAFVMIVWALSLSLGNPYLDDHLHW